MRYGLDITSAGPWGRPDQIAELATLAEDHGWDGVFCEDYLAFPGGGRDVRRVGHPRRSSPRPPPG